MPDPSTNKRHQSPWWFSIANKPHAPLTLLALILLLTLLFQYSSSYTLIEDEAHYWEWSRKLDWSYYSKGPGIALLIRASTSILGTSEFAIRAPAALSAALGALACVLTARELFADRVTSFISAILYFAVPGFAVSSFLMTIDAPYLACWSAASFFAARALLRARSSDWFLFGLTLALGFLFKYTILLLIPGVLLAALLTRNKRPRINAAALTLGTSLVLLGLLPILVWNTNHDYATLRHLLGHLGHQAGDTSSTPPEPYSIRWTLEYPALLALVCGSPLALAIFGFLNTKKHANESAHTAATTLICFALPVLLFYLLVSFRSQVEGNWPMSALASLVPLSAWAAKDAITRNARAPKLAWGIAFVSFLLVFTLFPLAQFLSTRRVIGPLIPITRITGMREHAQATQLALDKLQQQTNLEPFIITSHYGRASLLAFYLDNHPTIYCASAHIGGRRTQYDLWAHTDLTNPRTHESLRDRPALIFGASPSAWSSAFESISEIAPLESEPKENQSTFAATRYTGFPARSPDLRKDDQP
jgi:undecaprenyl-diphosphatase